MTATDQMSPDAESAPASRSKPANQSSELLTGVWADLVGQENAVRVLRRAVSAQPHAMSHAWLLTGPPFFDERVAPTVARAVSELA